MSLLTRKPSALSRDEAFALKTWVRLNVTIGDCFEWARVPREEQTDLAALIRKAATETDTVDWDKLTKSERKKAERLLALGAGEPADYFDAKRREADVMRQFAELGVKSRRRSPLKRQQEADWFQVMHAQLASGHLFVSHVSILTYVVAVLQSGKTLGPMQSIEGNGDDAVIAFDQSWGLLPGVIDGEESLLSWKVQLEWLAEHDWLTLSKAGPTWRVGLGKATLVALRHGQVAA